MLFMLKMVFIEKHLPLRIPAGVTVQGESLRGTEIRPASGTGHQIATINKFQVVQAVQRNIQLYTRFNIQVVMVRL
jgi:hypothetical protein